MTQEPTDGGDRRPNLGRGRAAFLHVLVFLAGAAVLAVEILGTRLLSPRYGASLYVWASLISVTLACIALGSWLGGKLADRWPGPGLLYAIPFVASVALLAAPRFGLSATESLSVLGLRWGALASALALFGLPLTALGAVVPCAVRLSTPTIGQVGSTAGRIYAISGVGGVAGALGTAFWLAPGLGLESSLSWVAAALLSCSAIGWGLERRYLARIIHTLLECNTVCPLPLLVAQDCILCNLAG